MFVLIFVLFVTGGFLFARKNVVPLPGLMKPGSIIIDGGQLIITDGPTVCIYSLNDFKLRKKFGKVGEGPREFKIHPNLNRGGVAIALQSDSILVNSIGKVSFYTRDGNYKDEIKTGRASGNLFPIGERYTGIKTTQDAKGVEYITINIFDSDFKQLKEMYRRVSWDESKRLNPVTFTQFPMIYVSGRKIFVDGEKDTGDIHVFDHEGKKLFSVRHDYKTLKFTRKDKDRYVKFFNNSPSYKGFLQNFSKIIKFPSSYPIIRYYHVAEGKVYVVTFLREDSKRECFIFDTHGKFLKRVWLPLEEMSPLNFYPYTTHDGKLYQLNENLDTEEWELQITPIL